MHVRRWLLGGASLSLLLICIYQHSKSGEQNVLNRNALLLTNSTEMWPLILDWTRMWDKSDTFLSQWTSQRKFCPQLLCEFTNDRSLIEQVDVLIFHVWDISLRDLPERKRRKIGQIYLFYSMEPPTHVWFDLRRVGGFFNRTARYNMYIISKCPKGHEKE